MQIATRINHGYATLRTKPKVCLDSNIEVALLSQQHRRELRQLGPKPCDRASLAFSIKSSSILRRRGGELGVAGTRGLKWQDMAEATVTFDMFK
jgi:hypothetical protein